MYNHYPQQHPWYDDYFQQLEQRLQYLEQQQAELKKVNKELEEQLKHVRPIKIDNINYKIQELVVRELKGTLNIGLTALSDADEISKLIQKQEEGEEIQLQDLDSNQNSQPDQDTNPAMQWEDDEHI